MVRLKREKKKGFLEEQDLPIAAGKISYDFASDLINWMRNSRRALDDTFSFLKGHKHVDVTFVFFRN